MKTIKLLVAALVTISMSASCVDSLSLTSEVECSIPVQTKSEEYVISEAYSFSKVTDVDNWASLNSIEEMFIACHVPDTLLKRMTTKAIMETCISYPLAFIHIAYNNELDGIDVLFKNSSVFEELSRRDDALDCALELYSEGNLDILSVNFIELLMASGHLRWSDETVSIRLKDAVQDWLWKKENETEKYSFYSKLKTLALSNAVEKKVFGKCEEARRQYESFTNGLFCSTKSAGSTISSFYVMTPYGQNILAYEKEDYSSSEKNAIDIEYRTRFPQATLIASATYSYNCHSYAWHMSLGGGPCWINYQDGVAKYWTNDMFFEISNLDNASRVYYYADHSAIYEYESGYCTSKWGRAPLMRHTINYGPYQNMNNRKIFRPYGGSGLLSGDDLVTMGEPVIFSTELQGIGYSYEWYIEFANGSQTGYTDSPNGNVNTVTFNRVGIFEVYCNVYRGYTLVGSDWKEVIVE